MLILGMMMAGVGRLGGEGADDDYRGLYQQLQDAERKARQGETDSAIETFREVKENLLAFRSVYPTWHPEIVDYRLRLIEEQLASLGSGGVAPTEAPPSGAVPALSMEEAKARLWEARVRQLEYERDELQVRLREALAARPATEVAPELRRAEERIRVQQKELDLLRFELARMQTETAETAGDRLDSGKEEAEVLRAENAELKRQLDEARAQGAEAGPAGSAAPAAVDLPEAVVPPAASVQGGTAVSVREEPDDLGEGRRRLESGRVDEALTVLARAVQSDPDSTEALTLLGRALAAKGLLEPAEAVISRALAVDAGYGPAHLERARLWMMRTPPARSEARSYYREALRLGVSPDAALERSLGEGSEKAGE